MVGLVGLQWDPYPFILLNLFFSTQASYAAPLILLAQNRQDDRDRVTIEQDRARDERNLADTEYLTREVAALRIALREVATRDFVRSELRVRAGGAAGQAGDRRRTSPRTGPGTGANPRGTVRARPGRRASPVSRPVRSSACHLRLGQLMRGGSPNEAALLAALATVIDPELRRPITELGMVQSVTVDDGGRVRAVVRLTIAGCPLRGTITGDATRALGALDGVTGVDVELTVMTAEQRQALKEQLKGAGGRRGIPFNEPALTDPGLRRGQRQGRRGQVQRHRQPGLRHGRQGASRGDRGRGHLRFLRSRR